MDTLLDDLLEGWIRLLFLGREFIYRLAFPEKILPPWIYPYVLVHLCSKLCYGFWVNMTSTPRRCWVGCRSYLILNLYESYVCSWGFTNLMLLLILLFWLIELSYMNTKAWCGLLSVLLRLWIWLLRLLRLGSVVFPNKNYCALTGYQWLT